MRAKWGYFKVSSLGYSFEPKGLSIGPKTLANFLDRIAQLYDQGANVRRIGQYVRNWWRWVRAGVEISGIVFVINAVDMFSIHKPSSTS